MIFNPASPGGALGAVQYNNAGIFGGILPVVTGNVLLSGGILTAPSWGKVGLTTHVSGILPVANGGTGTSTSFTPGSIIFAGSTGAYTQDNNNLFWADATNRLGLGTTTPLSVLTVVGGSATVPTMSLGGNLKQSNFNWSPFGNERQQIFSGASGSNGYGDMLLSSNGSEIVGETLGYYMWGQPITGKSGGNAGLKGAIGMVTSGSGGSVGGYGGDMIFFTKDDNSGVAFTEKARLTSTGNFGMDNTAPVGKIQVGSGTAATYTCGTISIDTFSAVINYDDTTGSFPTLGYTHGRMVQAYWISPDGIVWDSNQYFMSDYGGDVTDDGTSSATNSVTTTLQYTVTSGNVSGVYVSDYDTYNPYNYDTNFDLGDCTSLTTFDDFNDLWGAYTAPTPTIISIIGTSFIVTTDRKVGIGMEVPDHALEVLGSTPDSGVVMFTDTASGNYMKFGNTSGTSNSDFNIWTNSGVINIGEGNSNDGIIRWFNTGGGIGAQVRADGDNYFNADGAGFFGIGTNGPAYQLDVVSYGGGAGMCRISDSFVGNQIIFGTASTVGGTDIGFWSNTGIINIGDGSSAPAVLKLFEMSGTANIRLDSAGDSYIIGGQLGIATDTPTQGLDINATTRIRGEIYDQTNSAGSNGNIFTNNGSGGAWATKTSLKLSTPLFDHFTDANNGTTVETDLYSDTIPAGQLATNGDKIIANYQISCTGAALASQDIRIYFAGTNIYDTGALSIGAVTDNFTFNVVIIRVSLATSTTGIVRCEVYASTDFATLFPYSKYTQITGLTLGNTQILKITGQASGAGGASNQITAKLGYVEYKPAS